MTTLQHGHNHEVCRNYVKVKKIGHGGYGDVYKAVAKTSKYPGRYVALKQLKKLGTCVDGELPYWAKREVTILGTLQHENVVNLIDVCRTPSNCQDFDHHLVFEYCDFDMLQLISNPDLEISESAIRDISRQLLAGLKYLHQMDILHRDIKPENILITKEGVLKIADFGLSKKVQRGAKEPLLTSTAVSLWYRPPELLLGATRYGPEVDIWSAGCVLAQLFSRKVIMRGTTEQDQLLKISEICGSLSPEVWPDVRQLDLYGKLSLPKDETRKVKDVLGPDVSSSAALVLIDQMLMLDPRLRPTASLALDSDFFLTGITRGDLSALVSAHEDYQSNDLASQRKKRRTRRGKKKKRCQMEDDIVVSAGTVRET